MTTPLGVSPKMWLVIWPDGQRNHLDKEPLEGVAVWLKGVNATILEYEFKTVIRTISQPKKKPTK